MNRIGKRIGCGIIGAISGGVTTYMAMDLLGEIYISPIIIVTVLCFIAAFLGGISALSYIFKLDDYI